MGTKIQIDNIYKAVVERILASEERIRISPRNLVLEVCIDKFGLSADANDIESIVEDCENDHFAFFALFDLLRAGTKEYGYKMRKVPLPQDMNWGVPYNFEYYFAPPTVSK